MSFTKTISTFAALASIFGVGAAGFKLAQDSQSANTQDAQIEYQEKIADLEKQVSSLKQEKVNTNPPPVVALPSPQISVQQAPQPVVLPVAAPPPPPTTETP